MIISKLPTDIQDCIFMFLEYKYRYEEVLRDLFCYYHYDVPICIKNPRLQSIISYFNGLLIEEDYYGYYGWCISMSEIYEHQNNHKKVKNIIIDDFKYVYISKTLTMEEEGFTFTEKLKCIHEYKYKLIQKKKQIDEVF